jgi:membrane associated rhomboid family serine protease
VTGALALLRPRSAGPELTADERFAWRIRRLSVVAVLALGAIFGMWAAITERQTAAGILLGSAWLGMPSILWTSLRWPALRYLLTVPASLAITGMLVAALFGPPGGVLGRAGWLITLSGLLVGGTLGAWLWYRWFPVPRVLDDPFSRTRWLLVGVHIALVTGGLALMAVELLRR